MSIDPNADLVLRWEFDPSDIRKVKMYIPNPDGSPEPLKLFTFSTYERMSTYYRFNLMTGRYENAGDIEWNSVYNIKLNMGIRSLHVEQMARRNKASSRSRRFKAMNGVEYKWRPVEDKPENLECVTVSGKRPVAMYTAENQTLLVHPRGHPVLDDIVVLCLVHLWRRSQNFDFVLPGAGPSGSSTT